VIGRPQIGVLAVQGAFVEHEEALRAVGAETREVRLAAELGGLDGLVIPGGESTTFGLVAARSGLLGRLREVIADGLPVFGTCAGMIMLARETTAGGQALIGGMDTVVRRNAFGRQVASFEADLPIRGLDGKRFPAVFIRAPWIEHSGPAVEILAEVDGHAVAARQDDMLVAAFHPEFTDDRRLHAVFVDMVRAAIVRREDDASGGAVRVRAQ
jgi:5'-phosphate synthase pdxT subunit